MASSFQSQISTIIHLAMKLQPKTVLDVGKGFGKYGFLLHEYIGINPHKRINPSMKMKEQSSVIIDAVDADPDLMLPHLDQLYDHVYMQDIHQNMNFQRRYDLVLMVDVIEHLKKEEAITFLKKCLAEGSALIVATPVDFFEQDLYESEYEHHVSHWKLGDFQKLGQVDMQIIDGGAVYLLSNSKIDIRGFGRGYMKKLRRIMRAIRNEI